MLITLLLILKKFICHSKELEKSFWEKISGLKTKEELTVKILLYLVLKPEQEWSCLTLFHNWLLKKITGKDSFLN